MTSPIELDIKMANYKMNSLQESDADEDFNSVSIMKANNFQPNGHKISQVHHLWNDQNQP